MKTLTAAKTVISEDGKTATVTFDIIDKPYSFLLAQRVTIGHVNPRNMNHVRHVQISNEAVFVKAWGRGVAFDPDSLVAVSAVLEPTTSFAPLFEKPKTPLTASIVSELPYTVSWEFCTDKRLTTKSQWNIISGETIDSLTADKVPSGNWIRCRAKNAVGETVGLPILLK
jgi:hypothetical protein